MKTSEFEPLERDLDDLFAVPVPAMRFSGAVVTEMKRAKRGRPWKFAAGAAIAAAAVLGAVVVLPNVGGGGPGTASAQELIERSIAANPANYHMVTVARTADSEVTTESWVGGANLYRVESRSRTDGGVAFIDGTVMSESEMWIYQGPEDALVIAHGPRLISVLPAPSTVSLSDHLAGWNADGCFEARVTGEERVAGRLAHVISVTPTPNTCPYPPKPLKRATIWIDAATDIALKLVYEGTTAEHSSSFESTLFEALGATDDSPFEFTPPAGASVVEFTDAAGLKRAFAAAYIVPRGARAVIEHDWTDVVVPANEGTGGARP